MVASKKQPPHEQQPPVKEEEEEEAAGLLPLAGGCGGDDDDGARPSSAATAAASLDGKAGCVLHVRGIGVGGCKSEALLRELFAPHGELLAAQIRDRTDAQGADTSWALVTMATEAAAQSALGAAVVMAPDGRTRLQVTEYSRKQAAASTGGMTRVLSEAKEVFARLAAASARPSVAAEGKRLGAGDTLNQATVGFVRYSRDMCTLFVGCRASTGDSRAYSQVLAIDVQTSTVARPAPQHADGGLWMDLNADETRACTTSMSGMVQLYDTTDMSAWVQLWEHKGVGIGLDATFSHDGTRVVTAHMGGGHLTVLDAETGKVDRLLDLRICPAGPLCIGATIAVSLELLVGSGGFNTPDAKCVKIWYIGGLDNACALQAHC